MPEDLLSVDIQGIRWKSIEHRTLTRLRRCAEGVFCIDIYVFFGGLCFFRLEKIVPLIEIYEPNLLVANIHRAAVNSAFFSFFNNSAIFRGSPFEQAIKPPSFEDPFRFKYHTKGSYCLSDHYQLRSLMDQGPDSSIVLASTHLFLCIETKLCIIH